MQKRKVALITGITGQDGKQGKIRSAIPRFLAQEDCSRGRGQQVLVGKS